MTTSTAQPSRRWFDAFALGFNYDRRGRRRQVAWPIFIVLGLLLPGLSLFAIYRAATTSVPLHVWVTGFGLYWFTLLGISATYHREVTHRSFRLAWPIRLLFLIAGGMAWEGNVRDWVSNHRAHHDYADIIGYDPHTPWEYDGWKGLAWAQGVWLFFMYNRPGGNKHYADLDRDPLIRWQASQLGFPVLAVLSLALPCFVAGVLSGSVSAAINSLLIAGVLRIAATMTVTGFVNSVCHMWGTRTRDSKGHEYAADDSRNNVVVALLVWGEGGHSGHHLDQTCAHHGFVARLDAESVASGVRQYRNCPDATYRLVCVLESLHLARKVRHPKREVIFGPQKLAPKKALRAVHDARGSRAARRAALEDARRDQGQNAA